MLAADAAPVPCRTLPPGWAGLVPPGDTEEVWDRPAPCQQRGHEAGEEPGGCCHRAWAHQLSLAIWGPHKGAWGWGCLAGGVSAGWRPWAMPRWGKGYEGCGESWALPAASWGWQDPWGIGGAVQLWRGREMCSPPRSASSARAPAGFISSRWVPQMDQFKSGSGKSSRVPARGAVAVTYGWQCHGQHWVRCGWGPRHCWRAGVTSRQHPGCLLGTTATSDRAVTVTTGANLGQGTACILPRHLSCLSCPFPRAGLPR